MNCGEETMNMCKSAKHSSPVVSTRAKRVITNTLAALKSKGKYCIKVSLMLNCSEMVRVLLIILPIIDNCQ